MLAALIVRQRPVVIDEEEVADQLIRPATGEAVVIRGVVALLDQELALLVVHHPVAPEERVVGVLDGDAVLVVLEHRVVDRRAVVRLAAPADALDVLVHRVAEDEAIRRLQREVDAAVLVPEQGIPVGGDLGGPVHPDALPAPVGRVVDGDSIARALVEPDAGVDEMTEGEAHHRDVMLLVHADAVSARHVLHRVCARRFAIARVQIEHLGVRIVVEAGGPLLDQVDLGYALRQGELFPVLHPPVPELVSVHLHQAEDGLRERGLVHARGLGRGGAQINRLGAGDHHEARGIAGALPGRVADERHPLVRRTVIEHGDLLPVEARSHVHDVARLHRR